MSEEAPAMRPYQIEASPVLLDEALRLYVDKMIRDGTGQKPWLSQPSNLISVVAISLTLLGVVYGFWKDKRGSEDKDLQALSAIVLELTKLDTDQVSVALSSARAMGSNLPSALAAGPDRTSRNAALQLEGQAVSEWGRIANNRRLALLAEAGRLTTDLGNKAPVNQLLVLGTAFQQISDFETAEKYYLAATGEKSSVLMQAMGWKSAAIVNVQRGPAFYAIARVDFVKASNLLSSPTNFNLIGLAAGVEQAWATFELVGNDLNASLAHLIRAKKLASGIPCVFGRSTISMPIDRDIQQAADLARRDNIAISADVAERLSKLTADGGC